MSAKTLRFVVIGAGLIGPRHAELILKRSDCSLFAIVDRSVKGPSVASECNALHFNNIDELFEFCESYDVPYPDAAIVATPNHSHACLGKQLAEKGIHLLVEKPLASTPEDCISLVETCERNNVVLLVGHHRRFNPYIVATKEHMHKIGQPIAIQGVWALRKHQAYFDEKAWRRSKYLGGGALMINLIHDLDLLQYLLGPIVRVYAELLPCQRRPESTDDHVDEGAALTLRFANGCCGTFLCSDNVTSPFAFECGTGENPLIPQNYDMAGFYRIFGANGTLSVPDFTLYHQDSLAEDKKSWWSPVNSKKLLVVPENHDCTPEPTFSMLTPPSSLETKTCHFSNSIRSLPQPFDLQLEHFVHLVTGKELENKCSGIDALRALLCIEAVMKSIDTQQPQTVNFD